MYYKVLVRGPEAGQANAIALTPSSPAKSHHGAIRTTPVTEGLSSESSETVVLFDPQMGVISQVSRESKATAVVLVLAWLAVGALSVTIALVAAPAFALFFVLSLGFFPGEELIVKAREFRARPREWSRPVLLAVPVLPVPFRPVGLKMAFSLAVRPPPAHL